MPQARTKHSSSSEKGLRPWWGAFALRDGQCMAWTFGPKRIVIGRSGTEWRIWEAPREPVVEPEGEVRAKVARRRGFPDGGDVLRRFAFGQTAPELAVTPCTADRPVLARPATPVTIPPGEEVLLFISSPLWLRIEVHKPCIRIADMPMYRPSDIWVGANTREGRLCYSSRTHARMHAENLPLRAQRAVTPVRVRNADTSPFMLEKLNIPVPYLSLFATEGGDLWTEEVSVVRKAEGDVALKIGERPAHAAIPVAAPREATRPTSVLSFIGDWLG